MLVACWSHACGVRVAGRLKPTTPYTSHRLFNNTTDDILESRWYSLDDVHGRIESPFGERHRQRFRPNLDGGLH